MMVARKTKEILSSNVTRSEDGQLQFASYSVTELAKEYGTPLYLYDETRIREKCRSILEAVKEAFGSSSRVLYASKAASFKQIYRIMKEEGLGIDVVSRGEIFTAHMAGFPLDSAYFHSNNKTDEDISYAISCGVGHFVVDGEDELLAIDRIAKCAKIKQKVLLRLTPGIDPHTYAAVATGKVDSKFGSAIETGQAKAIVGLALSLENIELHGYHCHVGSQLFDAEVFLNTARVMLEFVAEMKKEYGYEPTELDLGGGFGVRYIEEHPVLDVKDTVNRIGRFVHGKAQELNIRLPKICFEPGRYLVADAGMTVYTVGSVKRIPGYKSYVSVDGGMTDNPRFALYGSPYTIVPVGCEVPIEHETMSVVGRCCESGDILQENVPMPSDIKRGDLVACLTTGAYNYSMASNYNRIPRPPVVMLGKESSYLAVRRETPEDIIDLDY